MTTVPDSTATPPGSKPPGGPPSPDSTPPPGPTPPGPTTPGSIPPPGSTPPGSIPPPGDVPPVPPPPAAGPGGPYGSPEPAPRPPLRRSSTNRVLAGVSGGLGEYFGVDPVLFRVLFATSAFFGGAGILAYVLAWIAIPEAGTTHAAVDRWIGALRRRRVPFWLVAILGTFVFWAVAFSWWAPGPIF